MEGINKDHDANTSKKKKKKKKKVVVGIGNTGYTLGVSIL
jgi:hypothetical protein